MYNTDHYENGREFKPINIINELELNFNLGNVVKYISRAGRKGELLEDLEKALFYAELEFKNVNANNEIKSLKKEIKTFGSNYVDVSNDWDLSENLTEVLKIIYDIKQTEELKSKKNIIFYESIVEYLKKEIEDIKNNLKEYL